MDITTKNSLSHVLQNLALMIRLLRWDLLKRAELFSNRGSVSRSCWGQSILEFPEDSTLRTGQRGFNSSERPMLRTGRSFRNTSETLRTGQRFRNTSDGPTRIQHFGFPEDSELSSNRGSVSRSCWGQPILAFPDDSTLRTGQRGFNSSERPTLRMGRSFRNTSETLRTGQRGFNTSGFPRIQLFRKTNCIRTGRSFCLNGPRGHKDEY